MTSFLVDTRSLPQQEGAQPQSHGENEVEMHDFSPDDIFCDPALRQQINDYHPDVQDQVRRSMMRVVDYHKRRV
jgi:hypothetical protein